MNNHIKFCLGLVLKPEPTDELSLMYVTALRGRVLQEQGARLTTVMSVALSSLLWLLYAVIPSETAICHCLFSPHIIKSTLQAAVLWDLLSVHFLEIQLKYFFIIINIPLLKGLVHTLESVASVFEYLLYPLLATWPWERFLISLTLSFIICEMEK